MPLSEPELTLAPGARLISELQEPTRVQESGGEEANFRLIRELADLPIVARFTIEGEPCSKSRARFTKRGSKMFAYTPEKTLQAEKEVARLFREAAQDREPNNEEIIYGVMALFFCGTRQRRDVDNMMKLILDGLNKVAWHDDTQVTEISARKGLVLPADARTEIVVYQVGETQRFTANCLYCEKKFPTFQSWATDRPLRKFCSLDCAYDFRRKKNIRVCKGCGSNYQREDRPQSKYCSNDCGRKFMGPGKSSAYPGAD